MVDLALIRNSVAYTLVVMNTPATPPADNLLDDFIASLPVRTYQKGQSIIQPAQPINYIFTINSGFVRGFDISEHGDTQVIWYGRPGDIFPLPRIFDSAYQAPFFYDAFTDCRLTLSPADQFEQFIGSHQEALLELSHYLTEDNTDTLRRLHALAEPKAHDKLLRILDFFAHRFGGSPRTGTITIDLPLTQQDIANFIGLTRETVSHELTVLRELGVIDYEKASIQLNRDKLSSFIEE